MGAKGVQGWKTGHWLAGPPGDGLKSFPATTPLAADRVFFPAENVSGAEGKKNQNNALLSYSPPTISWLQPKLGSVEGGSCSLKVGNSLGVASLGRERVFLWVIATESPSLLNRQEEEDKNLQHKKQMKNIG